MSKVNIRFIYGNQHTVLVQERQKGPYQFNWNSQKPAQPQNDKVIPEKTEPIIQSKAQEKQTVVQKPVIIQEKPTLNITQSQLISPGIQTITHEVTDKKRPKLDISDINESDFIKNPEKKQNDEKIQVPSTKITDQTLIGAPTFKKNAKKDYIKGQKAEKYEYSNIPEKEEDDFVGCFGCMKRKPKTYSLEKEKK